MRVDHDRDADVNLIKAFAHGLKAKNRISSTLYCTGFGAGKVWPAPFQLRRTKKMGQMNRWSEILKTIERRLTEGNAAWPPDIRAELGRTGHPWGARSEHESRHRVRQSRDIKWTLTMLAGL